MEDRSPSGCGKDVWSELLQATQDALSTLRADELEDLARRVEDLAARVTKPSRADCEVRESLVEAKLAVPYHQLLGKLLIATNDNLQVLRKLYCQQTGEGMKSPWAR